MRWWKRDGEEEPERAGEGEPPGCGAGAENPEGQQWDMGWRGRSGLAC